MLKIVIIEILLFDSFFEKSRLFGIIDFNLDP
jgi:hypothetical protein